MQEPGELSRAEALLDLLLETPDEQHLSEELAQEILGDGTFLLDLGHLGFEFMLRLVSVVEQWREILGGLPEDWADARLRLTIEDSQKAARAAPIRGPILNYGVVMDLIMTLLTGGVRCDFLLLPRSSLCSPVRCRRLPIPSLA